MFACIYQGYLKKGKEAAYKEAWKTVASYFMHCRGSLGSSLHVTEDGLWVAYSRWPCRKTRDASWPQGKDGISNEIPLEIQQAIHIIKDSIDESRKIPDICMEVLEDLLSPILNA